MTRVTVRFFALAYSASMESGYNVYRKLRNGELLQIAWRAKHQEAEQLIEGLKEFWPAEYVISEVRDVHVFEDC